MDKAEANSLQVRVELQADCFAGIWADRSQKQWQFIEQGDVEAAMQTASAIGETCGNALSRPWLRAHRGVRRPNVLRLA